MSTISTEAGSYVLFELAGGTYGVRSADVQQLEMVGEITPVPNSPLYVKGVVAVRGAVIPVIDLRVRFGFPAVEAGLRSRLLVVRNRERTVAMLVDTARSFARIDDAAIEPPPRAVAGLSGRYLRGLATLDQNIILVLDIAELLDAQFELEMAPVDDEAESGIEQERRS